jgi:hypothetical protein
MRLTSLAERRSAFGPAVLNAAVTGAVTTVIMFGFARTTQAQIPSINIEQTCRAAAGAMVGMSKSTIEEDSKRCLDSEQKAREQIIKDQATYSTADKKRCLRTGTYLPSYVEWLTCLEMERDVRKMQEAESAETDTMTLPRVRPKRLD